jgi:hypothetical protein
MRTQLLFPFLCLLLSFGLDGLNAHLQFEDLEQKLLLEDGAEVAIVLKGVGVCKVLE